MINTNALATYIAKNLQQFVWFFWLCSNVQIVYPKDAESGASQICEHQNFDDNHGDT